LILQLDKEMVVDLACGMAVLRGADVFHAGIMAVNGKYITFFFGLFTCVCLINTICYFSCLYFIEKRVDLVYKKVFCW